MIKSRRGFLSGLAGAIFAPAVVRADSLMKLHQIPERYATVWGVGYDLEVVEHVIWTPEDALTFARYNALDKFREVTDVVYTKPQALLTPMTRPKDWLQRKTAAQQWFLNERRTIVDETTGFTNVAGYGALEEWKKEKSMNMLDKTKHLSF